jgi:hypothetical protein
MVDCCIRNETKRCIAEPLPEYDVLVHCRRLQLLLLAQVKYLEGPGLCLERNDLFRPVHDGTIGFDRSPDDIVIVFEINDNYFGGFAFLFSYTDV